MTDRVPVTTISTPYCPASVKARMDGATFTAPHLELGQAVHKAAQAAAEAAYMTAPTSPTVEAAAFLALHDWQQGGHPLSNDGFTKACEITDTMLGEESSIWFGRAGDGRDTVVERTFYLDEEFQPTQGNGAFDRYGDNGPTAAYAFTIDRLDYAKSEDSGGIEILDYKNQLQMLKKGEADTPQGRFYSFGISQHQPQFAEIGWKIALTRHGYTVREKYTRGEKRLTWARDMMAAKRARIVRAVETGEFPATVGDDCSMCPIRNACTAFSYARIQRDVKVGAPGTNPRNDVGTYLALKPYVASLERELKKHADTVGPIPVNPGEAWGYHTKKRNELVMPVSDVLADLSDLGATRGRLNEFFPGDRIGRGALLKLLTVLAAAGGQIEPSQIDDPEVEILNYYEKRTYQTAGVHPVEVVVP